MQTAERQATASTQTKPTDLGCDCEATCHLMTRLTPVP